jgi:hypothetical protein
MRVFFIADAGAVCQCWESAEATMDGCGKENPVNSMFRDFSGNSAEQAQRLLLVEMRVMALQCRLDAFCRYRPICFFSTSDRDRPVQKRPDNG